MRSRQRKNLTLTTCKSWGGLPFSLRGSYGRGKWRMCSSECPALRDLRGQDSIEGERCGACWKARPASLQSGDEQVAPAPRQRLETVWLFTERPAHREQLWYLNSLGHIRIAKCSSYFCKKHFPESCLKDDNVPLMCQFLFLV